MTRKEIETVCRVFKDAAFLNGGGVLEYQAQNGCAGCLRACCAKRSP